MSKNSHDGNDIVRGWRLVGEYAHSSGCSGDQAILAWLMVVVQAVDVRPSDLERITVAVSRAAARVERDAEHQRANPSLVVRVFVSTKTEATTAPRGWGFFVLEPAVADMGDSHADADQLHGRLSPHLIEVYIYAEGSPA